MKILVPNGLRYIVCLSETYRDSSISSNDNNLTIPGHDL